VEVEPGDYAVLSVTDTGSGMTPEVVERVFEPFFTTKKTGKGSGLGLSMIYGFVQQSGGHMEIDSEVGRGTTVRICLPKAPADALVHHTGGPRLPDETASKEGSILVVEDDRIVRAAMKDLIDSMGYRVRVVADGPEALAMLADDERIDLLFVDVMLGDRMTGVELAELARKSRPGIKLLFTSGYTEQELMTRGGYKVAIGDLLHKPFQKRELADKLNAIFEVGENET
jgi:CheY-like chemotaxis protein